MHEASLARALLNQVAQIARDRQGQAVLEVIVQVGPLSGVEPLLLVEAFSRALHVTFLAVIPVAAIGFVVVLFLKELPLRESAHIGMEAIGDDLGVASDPIGDPVPVPEPADTDISASHPNKAKG